jgi:hypothetical protein
MRLAVGHVMSVSAMVPRKPGSRLTGTGTAEAITMATLRRRAWLDAGWRVESVNQAAGEVVFTRSADGQLRNPAVRPRAAWVTLTHRSAPAWRCGQRLSAWIPGN